MRTILLNPGPVTLSERVRQALAKEDLCHREPEFAEMVRDIRHRLLQVYTEAAGNFDAIILTGSGTCAVEAMLATFIPKSGKALVAANGVYGERMAAMIRAHGKQLTLIRTEWPCPIDFQRIGDTLEADKEITKVLAVHNETTTGRLNDLDRLGEICRQRNVGLMLDAVSSFGAEKIDFDRWNIEAIASTANKCVHGAPGIAFVMARKALLDQEESHAKCLYLDLLKYYHQQRTGYSPFTQAVHVCAAFQEALIEHSEQGGWRGRNERYRRFSERIRRELGRLGMELFLEESAYCSMITSFHLPRGSSYELLHAHLKKEGFIIYAGQGGLSNVMFRIANMGDIHDADVSRLIDAIRLFLVKEKG